jgi:hypothetical protein
MSSKLSWKSWPVVSVALFGVTLVALALSQQAPAGPNVTVYESPT